MRSSIKFGLIGLILPAFTVIYGAEEGAAFTFFGIFFTFTGAGFKLAGYSNAQVGVMFWDPLVLLDAKGTLATNAFHAAPQLNADLTGAVFSSFAGLLFIVSVLVILSGMAISRQLLMKDTIIQAGSVSTENENKVKSIEESQGVLNKLVNRIVNPRKTIGDYLIIISLIWIIIVPTLGSLLPAFELSIAGGIIDNALLSTMENLLFSLVIFITIILLMSKTNFSRGYSVLSIALFIGLTMQFSIPIFLTAEVLNLGLAIIVPVGGIFLLIALFSSFNMSDNSYSGRTTFLVFIGLVYLIFFFGGLVYPGIAIL